MPSSRVRPIARRTALQASLLDDGPESVEILRIDGDTMLLGNPLDKAEAIELRGDRKRALTELGLEIPEESWSVMENESYRFIVWELGVETR